MGKLTEGREMNPDQLAHLCKLASVKADTLVNEDKSRAEWIDYINNADPSELWNEYNCLSILAEAFIELMNRAGMKPKFRVPAGRAALSEASDE